MPKSAEISSAVDPQGSGKLAFGQILEKHLLTWGTRPSGQPGKGARNVWTKQEFADAVGVDVRSVRNWCAGRTLPNEIESLVRVLFGANEAFEEQRLELREAYISSRRAGVQAVPDVAPPSDPEARLSQPAAQAIDAAHLTAPVRRRAPIGSAVLAISSVAGACILAFLSYNFFDRHFSGLKATSEKGVEQTEQLTEQLKGVRESLYSKEGRRGVSETEPATGATPQAPFQDTPVLPPGTRQGATGTGGLVASNEQSFLLPPIEPGSVALGPFLPRSEGALGSDRLTAESQKNFRELSERKKRRDEAARADQHRAARELRKTAERLAEAGDRKGAINHYVLAIQNDPIISDYLGVGDLLYKEREFAKAATGYGAAIKLDKHLATALAARGDAYREQRKPELVGLAEADYADAIKSNPDYAPGYNGLGILAFDARRYSDAIKFYTAALEHDADFLIAYGNRGNAKYQLADYEGSIADCQKAIESVSSRTCLGNAYWKQQNFDKALAEYKHAEELDPSDLWPTNGIGNVYASLGNVAKAREQYKVAIDKNANESLPYNGLGNLAYRAGNYQEAIDYFSQAVEKHKNFALGYSNRGNAYHAMNDHKAALGDFEAASNIDDKLANPYLGRGKLAAVKGNWKQALAEFDGAISRDRTNAEAFSLRGFARLLMNVDGGLDDFNTALNLNPGFVDAYAGRAEAYVKIYEYSKARSDLDTLLQFHPKSSFAFLAPISIHSQMNDYDSVIDDCARLTQSGGEPQVNLLCGLALAVKGKNAEAIARFARIDPAGDRELFHFGKALETIVSDPRKLSEAIAEMDEAIRAMSETALGKGAMLQVRARLYVMRGQKGDLDLARQDYVGMIDAAPNAMNYKARADFLLKIRDYKSAIKDLEQVTTIAPKFADASRELGRAYYLDDPTGSSEKALKSYSDAIRNEPIADDYYSKGVIYLLRSKFNAENASDLRLALEEFGRALQLDPDFLDAYRDSSTAHQILREEVQALKDLDAAVAADAGGITALGWRANYFTVLGDFDRAIADVLEAERIAGHRTVLFSRKGVIYLEAGDISAAIANFDAAIEGSNANWQDRFNRGVAYVAIGQNLRAITDFSNALKLKRGYTEALRQRGRTYFILQQYQSAVGDYESLKSANPDDAEAKLMIYIARAKLDNDPSIDDRHASLDGITDAGQAQSIVDLFRGKRSLADLPNTANNSSLTCSNDFFVGEWHLLRNEKDAAIKSLSDAVRICKRQNTWSAAAQGELALLTSAWHRFWSRPLRILYSWRAAPT